MKAKGRLLGSIAAPLLAALLVVGLLGGCSSSKGPDSTVVEGTWVLESFGGTTELEPANSDVTTELTLKAGTASGNAGVNSFEGPYKIGSDNQLDFGQMAATLMAGPQVAMDQEAKFLKVIGATEHFEINEGKLVLSDADKNTLAVMVSK